jgi:hypothetical protein
VIIIIMCMCVIYTYRIHGGRDWNVISTRKMYRPRGGRATRSKHWLTQAIYAAVIMHTK